MRRALRNEVGRLAAEVGWAVGEARLMGLLLASWACSSSRASARPGDTLTRWAALLAQLLPPP
jgi:hypothetical protein